MPNSSVGQQEVEQQEEEVGEVGEVGEGGREEEFWQQDEEQVVKRRITVGRKTTSRVTSEVFRSRLQRVTESFVVPVKVNTMRVASERRMLRQVAFTEKVMSTSLSELRLLEQHFALDSNEKKVKAGKSTREG